MVNTLFCVIWEVKRILFGFSSFLIEFFLGSPPNPPLLGKISMHPKNSELPLNNQDLAKMTAQQKLFINTKHQ